MVRRVYINNFLRHLRFFLILIPQVGIVPLRCLVRTLPPHHAKTILKRADRVRIQPSEGLSKF
jgi:hypothetical protein